MRFADLLRRTLLQQLKSRINWQHEKALFYFATSPELEDVVVAGPKAKRTVVSVKRVPATDGGERVSYVKHLSFRPRFSSLRGGLVPGNHPGLGTTATTAYTRPASRDAAGRPEEA